MRMLSLASIGAVEGLQTCDSLIKDWTFTPSTPWLGATPHRLNASLRRRRPPPNHDVVRAPRLRPRWIMYFMYLPDGAVSSAHRFTLERLRRLDAGLLVVCALPDGTEVPAEILDHADAVVTKGLGGYDFSAYALGLRQIVEHSPGCDLFVMNDSVFGPFCDLAGDMADPAWDLTGYTAYSLIENHIQSYAFIMKKVDETTERALRPVLPLNYAYQGYKDVVFQQETRLARVASRRMTVGAKWYSNHAWSSEPSFFCALPLIAQGFPFLKKSLLHKRSDVYSRNQIAALLEDLGHPRP